MNKVIGGYFELEKNSASNEYYSNLQRFNSARNAIAHTVITKGLKKIHIPYYTCGVVIDTLKKYNISFEFYSINEHLEVDEFPSLKDNEGFLYTNYFGIKDVYINSISDKLNNLIIDNAQAFFSSPLKNNDTIYSARKFFGVPDGAYLQSSSIEISSLKKDVSYNRFSHLLKRIDLGAEAAYTDFQTNDKDLENEPIKQMSSLTRHLLTYSVDYNYAKKQRSENFNYLHEKLKSLNQLDINVRHDCSPMVYPFLTNNKTLRQTLIDNKIFVATYWPDVLKRCENDSLENYFTQHILPLPIDQRYTIEDMAKIISFIL